MDKYNRTVIDYKINASSIDDASKKFAQKLILHGYTWAALEVLEAVENGFLCSSNASGHNLEEGIVTFPSTDDWSYFWSIDQDEDTFYAHFMERGYLS